MSKSSLTRLSWFLWAGMLGVGPAFGEGEVGTQAYQWAGYSDLAPSPTTYSLADYHGKVVLLVVFQYNCGGCVANAPRFGRLADTLQSGAPGSKFQAVGAEISTATYAQIQNYRNTLTNSGTLTLNFPLVKVPRDTAIAPTDGTGEKWKRYNSYRDVYFVINHEGQITGRVDGNRFNSMTNAQYQTLRTALNAALDAVPASLAPSPENPAGFRMEKMARGFRFRVNDGYSGAVSLRILDVQGREVRGYSLTASAPEALWNGSDASGKPVSYGMYFAQVTGAGMSLSRRIPLLP